MASMTITFVMALSRMSSIIQVAYLAFSSSVSHALAIFVGTARFLKVNPVSATMTAKHVYQVRAGQQ